MRLLLYLIINSFTCWPMNLPKAGFDASAQENFLIRDILVIEMHALLRQPNCRHFVARKY